MNHRLPAHNSREEAIALKKISSKLWILLLLGLAAALALTGCASGAATMGTPTPNPIPSTDPMMPGMGGANQPSGSPMTTGAPDGAPSSQVNGGMTLEDAKKASDEMEDAVEKLSEVDEAYVVPLGDTALVGVTFTREYQGQADDRLKKMVLTRLQTVDKAVTGVAVTDNTALVTGIRALAKGLEGASSMEDVNTRAEEILKQLTVYNQ